MNNAIKYCVTICVIFMLISVFGINGLPEGNFFKYFFIPFHELVNILVLSIVVYYFVEFKNDERATKKQLEEITNRIIRRLENQRMLNIKNKDDVDFIRIEQRIIFNEIASLEKYANKFDYELEIKRCKNIFGEYWHFVSENIYDFKELNDKRIRLHSYLANVINSAEEITLKLYNR